MSPIPLAFNPVHDARTKHIAKKYHMVRMLVKYGVVVLDYIPTLRNIADVLTKPVSIPVIRYGHLFI